VICVMQDRRDVRRKRSGAILDSDWKCVEARSRRTSNIMLEKKGVLYTYSPMHDVVVRSV
jgi:predicted transcriptional regulator